MIVILGATGTGKSQIGINIAHQLDGEIINADSRQIYKGMTIGTAKPNEQDMKSVPHHLFDFKYPDESSSVFEFKELVSNIALEIQSRGKVPILVGGTGLYYKAVVYGISKIPTVPDSIRTKITILIINKVFVPISEKIFNV